MEDSQKAFFKRQLRVRRKHNRLAEGYVTKLNKKNGVMEHCPDRRAGAHVLRYALVAVLVVFAFKTAVLHWLGAEAYADTLATLQTGSSVERVGALVMQVDPVTARLADLAAGISG